MFQNEPIKDKKNVHVLQIEVIHFFKHSKKIGRAYFEIDEQNKKIPWKRKEKKNF